MFDECCCRLFVIGVAVCFLSFCCLFRSLVCGWTLAWYFDLWVIDYGVCVFVGWWSLVLGVCGVGFISVFMGRLFLVVRAFLGLWLIGLLPGFGYDCMWVLV